jgi:mRNA interferase RelE/StbE
MKPCAGCKNDSILRLNLTNAALSFLDDLPSKQFKQLVNTLFNLLKNPTPQDSSLLKGYPYRRIDFGEYRIVYQVQGEDLQVLVIGKRRDDDVYKKLSRLAK